MKKLLVTLLLVGLKTSHAQWIPTSAPEALLTWKIISNGQTVFACTHDLGVLRSTDSGQTWEMTTNGLEGRTLYSLALNGSFVLAGTDSGLYRSTDNGSAWQSAAFSGRSISMLHFNGGLWFAGVGGNELYRSSDNGLTWPRADSGLLNNYIHTLFSSGSTLYAGTSNGVFSSTDSATTWSLVADGSKGVYANVRAVVVANGSLFAGGAAGIQRSTDGGASWARVDSGLTQSFIRGFAVHQSSILAYGWGGIFLSSDTGSTWTAINSGLPTASILRISNGDTTYIPTPATNALLVVGTDLFAGLDSNGIWRRPLSQIVSSVQSRANSSSLDGFFLSSNFPNPFNPTTRFAFAVPRRSNVTFSVFDLQGRRVQTVLSQEFSAGAFEIEWDASSLPSGVYICRLQAGSFQMARKVILQK